MNNRHLQGKADALARYGIKTASEVPPGIDPALLDKIQMWGNIIGHGANGAVGAYQGVKGTPAGESKMLHGAMAGGMSMGGGALADILLKDLEIPNHPLLSSALRMGGGIAGSLGGGALGNAAASSVHRIANKPAPAPAAAKPNPEKKPAEKPAEKKDGEKKPEKKEHSVDVGGPKGIETSEKKAMVPMPSLSPMMKRTMVGGLVGAGVGAMADGAQGAVAGGLAGAGAGALHNHMMTGANGDLAAKYRGAVNQLQGVQPPVVTPPPSVPGELGAAKAAALTAFGLGGWGN